MKSVRRSIRCIHVGRSYLVFHATWTILTLKRKIGTTFSLALHSYYFYINESKKLHDLPRVLITTDNDNNEIGNVLFIYFFVGNVFKKVVGF